MPVEKKKLKAGTRWRFDKQIRGRRITSPYIYLTKYEAQRAETEQLSHFFANGTLASPLLSPTLTVDEFLSQRIAWIHDHRSPRYARETQGLFRRGLVHAPDWHQMPPRAITADQVQGWTDKWAADLLARGRTRDEVNKALTSLEAAWNHPWGRRRGKRTLPHNPFAEIDRLPTEKRAKVIPARADISRVLLALEGEKRLFLEILHETAARQGEARSLRWDDYHPEIPALDLYTRKKKGGTKTPRRLKLSPTLSDRLTAWRSQNKKTLYIFQQSGPGPDVNHRTERWALNLQIEACRLAGVPYFPLHSWRHYRASKWLQDGRSLPEVSILLGHESVSTTDRYAHELIGI
ncbi:MAG: tyrosine-type recombinase/integrase [Thermodesulfobacteriota bacterium]